MPDDARLIRVVPATVHGRYVIRPPAASLARGWLVGFHGYAQNAAEFLEMLESIPAAREWMVVSVQALHPFYSRTNAVVANWMTRLDREYAIADNIAYVDAVLDGLEREFGPPAWLVFAGFSQGVAMAYRAAVAGRYRAAAVIAAGGDLPPELKSRTDRPWPSVVLCTGTRDDFYPPRRLEEDLDFLRSRGIDARPVVFDGGHAWSSEVVAAADRVLAAPDGGD